MEHELVNAVPLPATRLRKARDHGARNGVRHDTPGARRLRVRTTRWSLVATAGAIVLAAVIRAILVLSRDFPLNDGALFYLMTQELVDQGFRLPATTAYNAASIPFAYSPLGFYVAGALQVVTGANLMDLFRFLPLVFTALCVPAFYLLARDLIPSRSTVVAALVAFAVMPRSFLWLIMGGGLTRSLGFLFAILALWQVHRAYTRQAWRNVAGATAFASLTVLSHLGTAPFVAFSAALFFLFFGRHRFGVVASVAIALGTALLTAPWWVGVASVHGFAPFLAAGATGGTVFGSHTRSEALGKLAFFGLGTAEPLFPIIGALAIIGAFMAFTRRGIFLPVWWLATILLDTRAGATYASIPVALLAAIAIVEVLLPVVAVGAPSVRSTVPLSDAEGWAAVRSAPRRRQLVVAAVVVVLLGYGVASALVRRPDLNAEGRYLTSLTRYDRDAMAWVAQGTPRSSRFLIMVGGAAGGWWADRVAEWFPVLGQRASVATVQGTEWLPNDTFEKRERQYNQLQGCAIWSATCIERWSREHGLAYSHVYLPKTLAYPCCLPLEAALRNDPAYRLVFDGPGAAIFARRSSPSGAEHLERW